MNADPRVVNLLQRLLDDAKDGKIQSLAVAATGPGREAGFHGEMVLYNGHAGIDSNLSDEERKLLSHKYTSVIRSQLGGLSAKIDNSNARIGYGPYSA